jgi:hypothetical protein
MHQQLLHAHFAVPPDCKIFTVCSRLFLDSRPKCNTRRLYVQRTAKILGAAWWLLKCVLTRLCLFMHHPYIHQSSFSFCFFSPDYSLLSCQFKSSRPYNRPRACEVSFSLEHN